MRNAVAARRMLAKWARENEPADPAAARKFRKTVDAKRTRLEKAEEAPPLKCLSIDVEWEKSRTYGSVPTVIVTARLGTGSFWTARRRELGCGYDTVSSAVHGCLAGFPSFDRFVVEAGRKAWDAYAVERDDGFPRLSLAGKGMDVLRELFASARGWKWSERHGEAWDLYEAEGPKRRGK